MRGYAKEIIAELDRHGIPARYEHASKHARIYFERGGKEQFYVIPASPSDSARGLLNAMADIRRLAGIRKVKTEAAPRPKRRPSRRLKITIVEPPAVTPGADPWTPYLASLPPADLTALASTMWASWFHGHVVRCL